MKRRKFFAAASSLAVLAAALLTGCGGAPQAGSVPAGTLTLRVNPEIQIAYDEEGKVLSLTGENGDGKEIVAAYPDYIGKDCQVVVQELVEEIHEAGYFVEEMEGEGRRIVLELEPGSEEPRDDFLEDMGRSAEETVKELKLSSEVNLTGEKDGEDDSKKGSASSLTKDKKAEATPKPESKVQTGSSASKATDYDDTDYGPNNDGVTDYDDTDYGPNADGITDYDDTDYGPNADGITDYDDTDYGPNADGITDYDDTDYGPNADGITDYDGWGDDDDWYGDPTGEDHWNDDDDGWDDTDYDDRDDDGDWDDDWDD